MMALHAGTYLDNVLDTPLIRGCNILIDRLIIIYCGRLVSAPPCHHGLVGPADAAAFMPVATSDHSRGEVAQPPFEAERLQKRDNRRG